MNSSGNKYVALVDDDESVCRSLGRLLRVGGYQPVVYASAEAFLEDTKHPIFDCLMLDIQLEGMSGLDLKRKLTEVGDDTPVVFITAQDDQGLRNEAEAIGCAGFFRKIDPGAWVLDAVAEIVARRTREENDRQTGATGLPA